MQLQLTLVAKQASGVRLKKNAFFLTVHLTTETLMSFTTVWVSWNYVLEIIKN